MKTAARFPPDATPSLSQGANEFSHALRPMSDMERQQISDLRIVVPKLCEANAGKGVDDAYVLRWLRSKDGRFDETAEGLKKNMIFRHVVPWDVSIIAMLHNFRKAWDLDNIGSWTAPEVIAAPARV